MLRFYCRECTLARGCGGGGVKSCVREFSTVRVMPMTERRRGGIKSGWKETEVPMCSDRQVCVHAWSAVQAVALCHRSMFSVLVAGLHRLKSVLFWWCMQPDFRFGLLLYVAIFTASWGFVELPFFLCLFMFVAFRANYFTLKIHKAF